MTVVLPNVGNNSDGRQASRMIAEVRRVCQEASRGAELLGRVCIKHGAS